MIEINLLPEELRKKKSQPLKLPKLPALPIVAGIIGVLILVPFLLVLLVQVKKVTFKSLNKKYISISALSAEAQGLENELKILSSKIGALEKLSASRFIWAKKLNDLSDSVVSGIWLSRIYIKKSELTTQLVVQKVAFIIEGSSVGAGEAESASVGKFVNALKENKTFSEDFDEIELTRVESRKIRNTEVMDFKITCHFKKRKGL